jgi:hypothetical protein
MGDSGLRRISIQHLWILAVLIGIFAFVNTHPIRPHDFWWHMAIGREILESGAIPELDVYSQTMAGQAFASYQMYWLADVGLYAVYNLGGAALSVLVQSLIITLAYAVIFLLCFRVSRSLRVAAFGTIFAAALGLSNWNLRPQIMTYLTGALFLWAIYEYRLRPRKGWLLVFPAAMMIWVNFHGSFPIGLLLLGIWLLDEVFRALKARLSEEYVEAGFRRVLPPVIALVITLLATLVNPRGIGVYQYLVTMSTNTVVQNLVPEWAPPTFNTVGGTMFIVGLLLSALILAFSPRRPGFFQVICFLGFAVLALKTTRGIIWFGLVMAPVLGDHVAALSSKLRRPGRVSSASAGVPAINLAFLALMVLMGFISLPWFKDSLDFPESKAGLIHVETPVEATKFLLEEQPRPPVFHAMPYGSYLIWAAQPEYKVFADSRIELYPREIWHDYIRISNAQCGWEKRLEHYGINTLMLSRVEQPALVDSVMASAAWLELYQDRYAVVFVRAE